MLLENNRSTLIVAYENEKIKISNRVIHSHVDLFVRREIKRETFFFVFTFNEMNA